ncbi:uncharacterized protein V6R79_008709 [Siganus canaliculatus]
MEVDMQRSEMDGETECTRKENERRRGGNRKENEDKKTEEAQAERKNKVAPVESQSTSLSGTCCILSHIVAINKKEPWFYSRHPSTLSVRPVSPASLGGQHPHDCGYFSSLPVHLMLHFPITCSPDLEILLSLGQQHPWL